MSTAIKEQTPVKFSGADWLRDAARKELSPFGAEVADILGQVYRGIYHIRREVLHDRCDWRDPWRIELVVSDSGMSTHDFNHLTALVILCHDRCVRLAIEGCARNWLRLVFTRREGRDGSTYQNHPTLGEAVKSVREGRGLGEA